MGKRKNLLLRRVGRVFLVLVLLFIGIVLFIRSPLGQDIIVSKVTDYVSNKTNTKVEIDRLFLTFSGNLFLEGLYLEDKKGDTLIYSRTLEGNLPLSALLFSNEIELKSLNWKGLRANISRTENTEKFNFDFLIEALESEDVISSNTPSETLQIKISELNLEDFKIDYKDSFLGIESHVRLGKLYIDSDEFDLETLRFQLDDVVLSDSDITYKQTKQFIVEDTQASQLPYLAVNDFKLNKVYINYNSVPDGIIANVTFGDFQLKLPKADISKNDFEIDLLSLKNSAISLKLPRQNRQQDSAITTSSLSDFEWPEFLIKADKIVLENNTIDSRLGKVKAVKGQFNPQDLSITNLNLAVADLKYRPENFQLQLNRFSFLEKSGFQLINLAFDAILENTSASLSGMRLQTNSSFVNGDLTFQYESAQKLIDAPEDTTFNLDLPSLELAVREAFFFQSELAQNQYLKKALQHPFLGKLNAEGTLDAIRINDLQLDWGKTTALNAQGRLNHLTQKDALTFDFDKIKATSVRKDVLKFISEKDLGITIPQSILIVALVKGNLNNIVADASLQIPEGNMQLKGNYKNRGRIQFDGNLKVDSLQLDKLLANNQLGRTSFTMHFSGSGNNINNINAEIKSDFSQLMLKDYDFSNLQLTGKVVNGQGDINLSFKDKNLNFIANTSVKLDSVSSGFGLDLNVIGADLFALGATKENIKVGLHMKADLQGNSQDYLLNAQINNGIAVYDNEQYQLGDIDLTTVIDSIQTDISIDSDFLEGSFKSNASLIKIVAALKKQFKNYFEDTPEVEAVVDSVRLKANIKLHPNPILTEVFLKGIELDSISVSANFDATTKIVNAEIHVPFATYKGSSVDSLNLLVTGSATDLNFTVGIAGLAADPIQIEKTYLEGNMNNKELLLDFTSFDGNEKVVHIASEMTLAKDTTQLRISTNDLIFNKKEWSIAQDNSMEFAENFLAFKNVNLNRNSEKLSISNTVAGEKKEHIGVTFEDFKLQTFLSLLNPDEEIASGLVKGNLIIENPFGAMGIVGDFDINAFEIMDNALGNLSLDATSTDDSAYDFKLALKDGGADLNLTGDYAAAETGATLNLELDLNRIDLKMIEGFSDGNIKDSHGSLAGKINVSGTTADPIYDGSINFNATDFNVASLNSVFKISNETLQINKDGLYLDNFEVKDVNDSNFTLDGSISTKRVMNPKFDLKLTAENFKLLNSTKENNELFYGTASLDADISIKGNLELPKINGRLRIRKVTDITYVIPQSQLDVEERDGVVIFVNREDPDAILTRNDREETPAFFNGMDVKAVLEIAEDADFHVIIDKKTGDNLQISGDAALNLNMEPNGRINLSGRYELNSGHYETSLYNLVKRRFEINPGSTITWQGSPTDAKLDVTAVYKVETSASSLMSSVTSGQDISVASKYRQVLPFLVYLNVDGELLEPKLSFGLDMPEDEQGSLGGAVYIRIQQLNQQEAELNKQVFSLLALNRFYPDSGSDGSEGGTAAIARDNVNKVLSGELNVFSDKVFGKAGFEVDFDLDSFTDYQGDSPQDRTQLNINAQKKLFNNRLIVTAGSAVDVEGNAQLGQEETPIIGNVSLEYLLTKNGQYRLRGFRKNEYENIIDGQLIVTGIALIFNREFNKFSQLFNPLTDDTIEKDKDSEKKEKGGKSKDE